MWLQFFWPGRPLKNPLSIHRFHRPVMSAFTTKNRFKLLKSHNHALTQLKQKKKKEYKKLDKQYKKNPDEEPEDGGKAARQAINDQYMELESAMLDANAKALEDFDASKTKEDEKDAKKLLEQTRDMALNGNKATGGGSGGGGNNNNNNNQGESKKMSRYEKRKQKKLAEEARLAEEREQLEEGLDNLKEIEIEKITSVLEPLGFKIKDIKADGHCLFTSIAHQLALRNNEEFNNNKACFEMRKIATAHMKNNPNDFSPFVEGDFDE
jgi:OTU domain-containing protein 6